MTTRTSQKVGASNINPGTAVTTTAGTAVPAPGTVVPSIATATGVAAVKTAREGLVPLETVLAIYLQNPPAGKASHGAVSKRRIAAVPILVDLLRQYPALASDLHPEALAEGVSAAEGLDLLATDLLTLHDRVKANARRVHQENWASAGTVYTVATYRAKTDPVLKGKVAPIKAALKRGPLVDTTAAAISGAAHAATKAQTRAARSQQKAAAVTQSHTRAAQAQAANTRVRGTSPVPLANPQGPAASADVAPQGPAPGR